MAALLLGLGKVTVPVPGLPVAMTFPAGLLLPTVHSVLIEVLSGNTGKVYVGTNGLNKTTLANVLFVLAVPTANAFPTLTLAITQGGNAVDLTQLRFDADNANEGVLVSAMVA